VRLKR